MLARSLDNEDESTSVENVREKFKAYDLPFGNDLIHRFVKIL